jgi:hypothetical protein
MTQSEKYQRAWACFEQAHGYIAASARQAVEWAVDQGIIQLPEIDPVHLAAQQMARALREEIAIDANGRRYRKNHAIHVTVDGVQLSLWAGLETAPREHMEMAFTQRREQIVGDCVQLKTDVDVYNEKHPNREPIDLVLDFTDDVAEREVSL